MSSCVFGREDAVSEKPDTDPVAGVCLNRRANKVCHMSTGVESTLSFSLFQNLPNPFSSETVIAFRVAKGTTWNLRIVDRDGRPVRAFSGNAGGVVTLTWCGDDVAGNPLPDGDYFAELDTGVGTDRRRLILMR